MSYHMYFAFSNGFSRSQRVPKGTLKRWTEHIKVVERILGLKRVILPASPLLRHLAEGN